MPLPVGVAVGDYLVAVVYWAGPDPSGAMSGWTNFQGSVSTTHKYAIFTAPYSAGLNLTAPVTSGAGVALCNAYYEAGKTVVLDGTPVAATNTSNNATMSTGAPTTGSVAGDFEVLCYGWGGSAAWTGTPAAGSARQLAAANGTTASAAIGNNTNTSLPASTACTAFSQTLTASNTRKVGIGVLLRSISYKNLTGTAAGTAVASAAVSYLRPRPVSGTAAGQATASATLSKIDAVYGDLSGTAAGAATTTAVPTRVRPVAATAAGRATATGLLTRRRALVAASLGRATTTAALTRRRALLGTSVGVASASGTISSVPATIEYVLWGPGRFNLEGTYPGVLWATDAFEIEGDYPAVYWHDGKFKVAT